MNNQPDMESQIQERLNEIKAVPARNPQAAARGRARFLTQAVSAREAQRHKGWRPIFRMQQFAMNLAVVVVVIAGLLFGGGATVRAAQNELPGQPLYGVKLFSEDVSLQFQSDPETKVDRLMQLAQTRVQEMTRLIESGQTPPEQVSLRLEQHVQQALQLCSNMGDAALDQKLAQVHHQLQQQESDMQNLEAHAGQSAQPVLEHTRTMLQAQLEVVDEGLSNHELFRTMVRNGLHLGQTQIPGAATPTATPSQEQAGQVTAAPGNQGNGNGLGPTMNPGELHAHVTPTPRNDHPTPGNNAGGNDKDKGKDPKDKDPRNNKPPSKTPKR